MSKDRENKDNIISSDDEAFEREIFKQEQIKSGNDKEYIKQQKEIEKQKEKERTRQLQREHVELMKLKAGTIEESEVIKEERDEKRVLSRKEKIANFWYHFKIPTIVVVFMLIAVGYITYDTLTREKPDMYILSTCNNGIDYRKEEIEAYFEQYCPDLNGDGEIHVQLIDAPISSDTDSQVLMANQAKVLTQLQSVETIIVLTSDDNYNLQPILDENGNYEQESYVFAGCLDDLREKFPNDGKFDEKGLKFSGEKLEKVLEWQEMPDNIILSLRAPIKPLYGSVEDMQENYDIALEIVEKIREDLD
ncbi:MAG: hypothetical protein GX896_05670 [Clostridiales bacterium]|nr:hypothetical protein [Clostridiales bacterium]